MDVRLTVLQAFAMCKTGNFNLSYESLTSFEAREKIFNLHQTDPKFWSELMAGKTGEPVVGGDVEEDNMEREAADLDDSAVDGDDVVANVVLGMVPSGAVVKAGGLGLARAAIAESIEYTEQMPVDEDVSADEERPEWADGGAAESSIRGAGKRKVTGNKYYAKFWHH